LIFSIKILLSVSYINERFKELIGSFFFKRWFVMNKIFFWLISYELVSTMVSRSSALKVVWPKDGAIVSPVFIMAKKDNEKAQKVVEFFRNEDVGKLLSSNGKFPTTVYGVDNMMNKDYGFLFCGWDYIHNNDIVKVMEESERIFNEEILK